MLTVYTQQTMGFGLAITKPEFVGKKNNGGTPRELKNFF